MHDSGELKCVFTQLPGSSAKKSHMTLYVGEIRDLLRA
jgi:hypothetical protein